ncbi:synaptotagmin-like protein 4 [Spea bombifrons]|uniref:synaptotagmin-like protein 4 n=1 Tax=Spea bombifrons TaxID=233779 RepID=UPI00234A7756|nr:synaptotagmin-like protein 4 [Spea bombifrons]XP_053329541.1 synaptotagmin-like protein 4 [Spea bombifrons]
MKNNTGALLDLSFLTEEEYEKLMNVLQRDAELQKKESDRIRRLQGSLKDEKKKKFVTGAWFHDVKAMRFNEDLQGSDLLRASIRRKKNQTPRQNNGTAGGSPEDRNASSSATPIVDAGNKSISNGDTETYGATFQTQAKPSFPHQVSNKRRSLTEVVPVDSVDSLHNTSPNADKWSLRENENHDILQNSYTDLGDNDDDINLRTSTPKDTTSTRKHPVPERRSPKDESSPSKIPVKRRTSKEPSRPEITVYLNQSDSSTKKPVVSRQSSVSSPEADVDKSGANFTVQSMKDKAEQETMVNREQFRSLKTFWETSAGRQSNSETELTEIKPNNHVSVQSNKKQTNEEWPEPQHRVKHFPHRAPVMSSSEDEMVHRTPPRKSSSSLIPRSTYGKSQGSPISKNTSLSESNGTSSHSEENSGASVTRGSKKSKLPVRMSTVNKEDKADSPSSPKNEKLPNEPQTEVDELIVPEKKQEVKESLYSRVKILIDAVSSDEEGERKSDKRENTSLQTETNTDEHPEAIIASRASGVSNAKSMVNIYTTTETYNKPQAPSQQLLEPERAKELSRSTPALLSETESDTASEISFNIKRHRKTHSSGSNSSDMASVSSVSNSVLSVYSGDFGSVDAQGTVQFSLDYDEKNREFQIFVAQCKDLAVVDEKKGRSDPYVKTYLLPDKARMGKRKTSVKKKTTNPVYNEVLRYKIEKMVLLIQKLNLSVWHNDPLGRNSFLGEMEIDLTSWDWSNTKPNWYTLKPRSLSAMNGVDHRGTMNLAIKYIPPGSLGPKHPSSGEVLIWVKDTKDLPQLRLSGVDSFVKCYVLPDTSKKSYQKTRVIKKDPNPIFNHTIVYDGFHTEDLKDACVELTVWDHEKLNNHFLGGIRLGFGSGYSYGIAVDWMDSTQEEVAFWQEMVHTPNEWIEGSLPLRSLAGRKKFK